MADAQGDGSSTFGILEVEARYIVTGRAEARTVEQQAQAEYGPLMKDPEIRAVKATLRQEMSIYMHIYEISMDTRIEGGPRGASPVSRRSCLHPLVFGAWTRSCSP